MRLKHKEILNEKNCEMFVIHWKKRNPKKRDKVCADLLSSFSANCNRHYIPVSCSLLSLCLFTGLTIVLLIHSLNKSWLSTRARFPVQQHAALWKHTQPTCSEETGWKATCSWIGWHAVQNSLWSGKKHTEKAIYLGATSKLYKNREPAN